MLILAFDTSGFAGSVALLDGPEVLREGALPAERRSAQTLAPAIDRLLKEAGVQPREVRLVATTIGPGSFTGLRVGVTTAKTFAYAVGAEVLGVSTLEAIAAGVPVDLVGGGEREGNAVLDAQRKELFVGRFRTEPSAAEGGLPRITRIDADRIVPVGTWLAELRDGVIVTGAGLSKIEQQVPVCAVAAARACWEPRAGA